MKIHLALICLTVSLAKADTITIHPDKTKQTIKGIGFEIQSDSIGSGNHGLPEEPIAVPHDLVPSERERLAKEMLKNFRYCRLAGGLYWRGLDPEKKFLQPRWPEQLQELKQLLDTAGVEGLSFEYWSPAPFWKANQSYVATPESGGLAMNLLRCFGSNFDKDPVYNGDTARFLADFANAVVTDIKTLKAAGIKTSMWGLQNEPNANHFIYSTCEYPDSADYVKAYSAVASAIRKYDPAILLFADTEGGFPKKIGPAMNTSEVASLVDAYVVHTIGAPSENVRKVHADITSKLPPRPWFQNEYEYMSGVATPDRCLNTVQHIMNSFQLAENPTWFWLHALKPLKNAEAGGYSLGFWKSLIDKPMPSTAAGYRRWPNGPIISSMPQSFKNFEMVSAKSSDPKSPDFSYNFIVNQPVTVYLLVKDEPGLKLNAAWEKTELTASWDSSTDLIFKRKFPSGAVPIPRPSGQGPLHVAFVEGSNPQTLVTQIGPNLPMEVRSETIALEGKSATVKPGHWIYNSNNWNAVGSFVRHMPWDCVALDVSENNYDPEGRIFAFKKPDGKVTIVISNRSKKERAFDIVTGLGTAEWKGFRYTPDDAGEGTMGISIGTQSGPSFKPVLQPQSWEFWEQQ